MADNFASTSTPLPEGAEPNETKQVEQREIEAQWFMNKESGARYLVIGKDSIDRLKNDEQVEAQGAMETAYMDVRSGTVETQEFQAEPIESNAGDQMTEFASDMAVETPQSPSKRARRSNKTDQTQQEQPGE
jgi:hypothetical protein